MQSEVPVYCVNVCILFHIKLSVGRETDLCIIYVKICICNNVSAT